MAGLDAARYPRSMRGGAFWVLGLLMGCGTAEVGGPDAAPAGDAAAPAEDAGSSPADAGIDAGLVVDAGNIVDAGTATVTPACDVAPDRIVCRPDELALPVGRGSRDVFYQLPETAPPAGGHPTVILFQGSFVGPALYWDAEPGDPFGAFALVGTVAGLLDAGFAVLMPEARGEGLTFWNTNQPPWSLAWDESPDHRLMLALFDAIADGTFGPLDPSSLFATGISSGGYMTSRMAIAYPGRFSALAVVAGSYATCAGLLCRVPDDLPADHPPTLFAHGVDDLTVPIDTMRSYEAALRVQRIPTERIEEPGTGHAWPAAAVEPIPAWFRRFR